MFLFGDNNIVIIIGLSKTLAFFYYIFLHLRNLRTLLIDYAQFVFFILLLVLCKKTIIFMNERKR